MYLLVLDEVGRRVELFNLTLVEGEDLGHVHDRVETVGNDEKGGGGEGGADSLLDEDI